MSGSDPVDWPADIHDVIDELDIRQIAYVPDSGHKRLIELCIADEAMLTIPLTSEEEGIGLLAGAWLGGKRGALLMQSSGVGNCINVIASVTRACEFPLLLLITMRGGEGEGNPWQIPMGRATAPVLETLGIRLATVDYGSDVRPTVASMARAAFDEDIAVGVLFSQRLIGAKTFQ